jgi:hypothetical protein
LAVVRCERNLKIVRYLIFLSLYLVFFSSFSVGAELKGPEVTLKKNEMFVTISLVLDDKYLHEIRDGIEKELVFYIDLFRVWDMWPDEFVLGESITRYIKCDPVKSEFVATSFDGNTIIEKRFKSLESLTAWALSIEELKLTNIRELEPGIHFVKITVASKIRKLPPLIGPFIIFLSENEFKISKQSSHFWIRPVQ